MLRAPNRQTAQSRLPMRPCRPRPLPPASCFPRLRVIATCACPLAHAGPFTRQGLAVGTEAHNPVLSRATDGTWLLWTCGCPHAAPPGCGHAALVCPGGKAAAWTTTVYSATSLDGPWEPHVDLLAGIGGMNMSQNVSPLHEANGTVMLMFKGPDNNTEASIAIADHWAGPYTLQRRHTNIFAAATLLNNITNEDCWWWRSSKTGSYHVLSHRMEITDRTGPVSGGYVHAGTHARARTHQRLSVLSALPRGAQRVRPGKGQGSFSLSLSLSFPPCRSPSLLCPSPSLSLALSLSLSLSHLPLSPLSPLSHTRAHSNLRDATVPGTPLRARSTPGTTPPPRPTRSTSTSRAARPQASVPTPARPLPHHHHHPPSHHHTITLSHHTTAHAHTHTTANTTQKKTRCFT